jgi:hypothetical protein
MFSKKFTVISALRLVLHNSAVLILRVPIFQSSVLSEPMYCSQELCYVLYRIQLKCASVYQYMSFRDYCTCIQPFILCVFSCSLLCLSALNAKSNKKYVLIESLLQATKRLDKHETIRGTGVGEETVVDWCRNRAKTDILKTLSCAYYVPVQWVYHTVYVVICSKLLKSV